MKLVFATRNQGKAQEGSAILDDLPYDVLSLVETNVPESFDVEETGATFESNARLKAEGFGRQLGMVTLADDSGLVVDALDGRPGVYSKRYGKNDDDRNTKLLAELTNVVEAKRTARFVSVICCYDPEDNSTHCEHGVVEGTIALTPKGSHGFGYDPIFIPTEGDGRTFAEYGADFKNTHSHRARALDKIKSFLKKKG